jgi:hypothetical protein
MFISAPAIQKVVHNQVQTLWRIERSTDKFATNCRARTEKLLTLFNAREICAETPLMTFGWQRELDADLKPIVADLLTRRHQISLLEIGAGTTWGSRDSDFGVPGFARILKDAVGSALEILATDRAQGFDIFLVLTDGLLLHHQYRDDRPPRGINVSGWHDERTLAPVPHVQISQSLHVDSQFKGFLAQCGEQFNFDIHSSLPRIYVRPRIDPEAERALFGVQSLGRVDYTTLTRSLVAAKRHQRFDFAYGRHLCPHFGEEKVNYLQETLPRELNRVAASHYVQFDRCLTDREGFADLVFRHHPHLFESLHPPAMFDTAAPSGVLQPAHHKEIEINPASFIYEKNE